LYGGMTAQLWRYHACLCRHAETHPQVEHHTATRLTMWMGDWLLRASLRSKVHWQLEFSCTCTCTGTSKGPCIRCNSSSLVERSRTERLGLGDLLVGQVGQVGQVGKRLRPGLRSKRSTPARAPPQMWHLNVGYFRTVSSV
jgi:hypothetical protein